MKIFLQNNSCLFSFFSRLKVLLFFVFVVNSSCVVFGAITTGGSGNWSSTVNNAPWPGGVVPSSSDDIIIALGHVVTVDDNYTCASLTINGGNNANGGISVSAGKTFTVTNAATINAPSNNNQNRYIQVDAGSFSCSSLSMTASGGDNRDTYLRISSGTATISGNITMDGSNARSYILFTGSGTLYIGGSFGGVSGGAITSAAGGGATAPTSGTVSFNSTGAQTIPLFNSYFNLAVENGNNKTFAAGNPVVNGNAELKSATTLTLAGNLSVGGDWTNNQGSLSGGVNTVTFKGTSGTNYINGSTATTFPNLVFSSADANIVNYTLDVDLSCTNLSIDDNVANKKAITLTHGTSNPTLTAGNVTFYQQNGGAAVTKLWDISGGTADVTGDITFTAVTTTASFIVKAEIGSGSLDVTGTVMFSSNTTDANQVIAVTGSGSANFTDWVQTNATNVFSDGTLSADNGGSMTFSKFFDMNGGTVTVGSGGTFSFNKTGATAFRYNTGSVPVFTTNSGSILNFKGDLITLSALSFANGSYSVFTGNTTVTPTASVIFGNLQINNGVTMTLAGNISLTNDWTNSGGTFDPAGTYGVTFSGTGEQIITKSGGETYYNLTYATTGIGPLKLASNTDVTVTNTLTMTSGLYNLNSRTFTLGTAGVPSTLSGSSSCWFYGGTFKRFWPNGITVDNGPTNFYGLFPMGTSNASTYRPLVITSGGAITSTNGYFTVSHVDGATTTDLSPVYNDGGTNITRISGAKFLTNISGVSGGTYTVDVTMTDLAAGAAPPGDIRLAVFTGGTNASSVGTHANYTGTAPNPTAKRTAVSQAQLDLNNDFRISTTNTGATPLRNIFYSIAAGGNWNVTGTWLSGSCGSGTAAGSAPGATDYVVICSGSPVSIDVSSTIEYADIQTGGTLQQLGGSNTFTVSKDLTTSGTGIFNSTSTGIWTISRNASLSGSGSSSCTGAFNVTGDLSVGAGTTLTMGTSSDIAGNLAIDGTLAIGATTLTLSGANKTISGSAGASSITGGGTVSATESKSIASGTNLTIAPVFAITNNKTVTNNGTIIINNDLTGGGGGAVWTNASNSTLKISGALNTAGVLNANAGGNTVWYSGAGAQAVKVPSANYTSLRFSGAGTKTLPNSNLTVTTQVLIEDGVVDDANQNKDFNGTASLVMTGGDLKLSRNGGGAGIIVPQFTGSYTLTEGTIWWNMNNKSMLVRNITPDSYYNVKFAMGSGKTASLKGNTTITNNLDIADGATNNTILDVTTNNYNITIGGNWNVTSTAGTDYFLERSGLVTFNGGALQTINTTLAAETFYDFSANNNIGVRLDDKIIVTNDLTIASGALLNANTKDIDISGDWTNIGGTFTPSTGTVDFKGTSQAITKPSAETFNKLTLSNSGTKTAGCDLSVADILTISGTAQLDMSATNYALSVGGNWNVTSLLGDPFVERNGTVTFNGTGVPAQTLNTPLAAGETFYNVIFSNNIGGLTLNDIINVTADLTINSGAIFNANGSAINLTGNWINNGGTFTSGTNTVTFNGSGPQTITKSTGETFYNLSTNTTGPLILAANTDVTVTNTLTMTSGLYNLNGRTFTLGASGAASTLSGSASCWFYGGTFKRFWRTLDQITTAGNNYGTFPMGTSEASTYRPVTLNTAAGITGNGYFTVQHVDASTVTDINPAGPESIDRVSDAQFLTTISGVTAGDFTINVTMTGLSGTGAPGNLRLATYSGGTCGVVGTHVAWGGSVSNPTVTRNSITTPSDLNNQDFRVATDDPSATPLRSIYYSRTSGDWNVASTWSTEGCGGSAAGGAPPPDAYVNICNGNTVTVNTGGLSADFVVIQDGGKIDGANSFTVNKDLSTAGSGWFAPTAGIWTISRNASLTGTGASSCAGAFNVTGNLSVSSGTSLDLSTSSAVSGDLTVDGTLDINATTLTLNGSSGKTISGSSGAALIDGTGKLSINTGNKSVSSTATISIAPEVELAAGITLTNNGIVSLTNTTNSLTGLNATTSIWTNASGSTLNVKGTLLTNGAGGVLNASANPNMVNYNGSGAQGMKIPSSSTHYNLKVSNAGTKTFATAGTITVTNALTLQDAAILDASTNTLNGAGGVTMSGTSQLKLAKSATVPELTGTYSITGGTIVFNGSGAQTIRSLNSIPSAYYSVEFGNNGAKTLAGPITVQGNLAISNTDAPGTPQLDVDAGNNAITLAGNWNVTSTHANPFVERSGTVTFNGSATQTISTPLASETFYHFTVNNTTGVSLNDNIVVSGNLTIESAAVLDCNGKDISVAGNWTNSGGNFVYGTRTVTFTGSGSTQTISKPTSATFYNIVFTGSATKSLVCSLIVLNDLTIEDNAQFDVSTTNYPVTIAGDWNITSLSADPFVARNGTATFNGTALQTIATPAGGETFYNIVTSNNTSGIVLGGAISIEGTLTINNGAIFDASGYAIGIIGNWLNDGGTFTSNNNTVTFSGSGDKTITSTVGLETFYGLAFNTTGTVNLQSSTDIAVNNTLTMTAGNCNLNGRTLTLGSGSEASLARTAGIVYGGAFSRYINNSGGISSTSAPRDGLFPIGTSVEYRPVEINSVAGPATAGYISATHTDASGVTDITYTDNEFHAIQRITDMKSTISTSGGFAGGSDYSVNITMTALSSTGTTFDNLKMITYTSLVPGSDGTHISTTGTFAAPKVGRSSLTAANLENDFVVGTRDKSNEPLRTFFYAVDDNNWNNGATWSTDGCGTPGGAGVPPSNGYAVICSGKTVAVDAVSTIEYVDISGTLEGSSNFNVSKDLATTGTGIFTPAGGTWTISRNATIAGTSGNSDPAGAFNVVGNLNVGTGKTLTLATNSTVTGNLQVDGTLALGTTTLALNGSSGKTISGTGSITGAATGMLNITTGDKTISSGTSLTIAPVVSIASDKIVTNNGTVTISNTTNSIVGGNGSSEWVNAASATLNAAGPVLSTGKLTASAVDNTVNYNGGAQTVKIPVSSTYYNLTITNAGTKTFASAGTITVNNLLTIQNDAVFNVSTNTLNGTGGLTMAGTSSELQLAKLSTTLPELTAGSQPYNLSEGTITFNGTGAQTIRSLNSSPAAYYNVNFSNSGIKTLAGAITAQKNLTIAGTASLDVTASNYIVSVGGDWSNTGASAFTERSGKVIFNGSAAQGLTTAGGETFYNLTINSSGGLTLNSDVNVTSSTGSGDTLTIESGATLNANGQAINLTAHWINNGGTFTPASNIVTFNGTGAQSITKTTGETFYDLIIGGGSGTGTTTLGSNITVSNDLTINNSAALDVSTSFYSISVGDDWSNTSTNGDPFVERNGTVTFNGSGAQTIAKASGETFYNIVFDNSAGSVALSNTLNVTNGLTINASAVFNANTQNINNTGNWTNNGGTFTASSGTVTFNGTGTQTITKAGSTETFSNFTSNKATGVITLESTTDVTVTGTLTMTSGLYDLNGRTFSLSSASTLTRTVSSTTNWFYGGTLKHFWPDATTITIANFGFFPMGTSNASSYRPLEISSSANITSANGYFTVNHVDAFTVTDLTVGAEGMLRISDAQFNTFMTGVSGGGLQFDLNVTMTGLGAGDVSKIRLAKKTAPPTEATAIGTHSGALGSALNPTAKRINIPIADMVDISNDFRIASTDIGLTPLRTFYYSVATDDWNDAVNTWSTNGCGTSATGGVPPSNGYAVICSGTTVTVNAPAPTIEFLEIQDGGALVGTANFTVSKDLTTAGSGVLNPTGGAWSVGRNATLAAGTLSSSSTGAFNVTGNLTVGAGKTLTLSTGSTVTGNLQVDGALDIGTTTLILNGNSSNTISGSGGTGINGSGGTISITAGDKAISAGTDLTIVPGISIASDRTVTNNGTITLTGNILGGNANSTWTNAANSVLNTEGSVLSPNGKLNAAANPNTVNYNKAGAQTVKIPVTSYYNLTISNSGGTKTFASAGTIGVINLLTIQNDAVFNTSTNTLNGAGSLTMTGTSSELQLGKLATTLPELTGTPYTINAGKITFNGLGAQTVKSLNLAPSAYYNIEFGGSGIKTLGGNITVQGNLSTDVTDVQFDASGSNYTISIAGNWNVTSGNLNPFIKQSGTVLFNGSAIQTINTSIASETFYNLTISNTAGVTLGDPINVTSSTGSGNALTINTSAILNAAGFAISTTGDWINNGGTFNHGNNIVTFSTTGAQSITKSSSETFYDITFSNGSGGTSTLGCNLVVLRDLLIDGQAILDVSPTSYSINVGRHWTVSSTIGNPFVERGGTVTFDGTVAQNQSTVLGTGETFFNLVIANTANQVYLTSTGIPTNVSNGLTINASATLNANGRNMNISGNWTNNGGTFTPGAGTVTFNGTGTQTITKAASTETFTNFTSNKTTGVITLAATTDVTVSGTLIMTSGLYDLNGRTFTLGAAEAASTLTRAASATTNWFYGGTFKRFWPDGVITSGNYGLFPMGTSNASSYRPFEISSSAGAVTSTNGYFTVNHVDASTVTDLTSGGVEGLQRISDAQFITAVSGISDGTYTVDVTMTGLGSTGDINHIYLAKYTGGTTADKVGTYAVATGSLSNPTAKRTAVAIGDLDDNLDYRISTINSGATPLRQIFYSVAAGGNWNDAGTWVSDGCGGSTPAGAAPPSNGYAVICSGVAPVTVNAPAPTIEFVEIQNGGTLDGTVNFIVTKDISTAGDGIFAPTAGTWAVSRNVTLSGTGFSSAAGALNITGNLTVGANTKLTLSTNSTLAGNLTVNGELSIGATDFSLSGASKTISGSGGTGISGTGKVISTSSRSISSGTVLTIAPVFNIFAGINVTNNGTITLSGNMTGVDANSTWTNATGSVLNTSGTVLSPTGKLEASANNTVKYQSTPAAQTVKIPNTTYYNLIISETGTKTASGNITVSNLLTIQNDAVFDVSTYTLDGGGLTMTGANSELKLAKLTTTLPELSTYTLNAGKITFYGAGAQTIRSLNSAPSAYYNLNLDGSGVKSLAGAITVQNNLTTGAGSVQLDVVSGSNYAINIGGNWNISSSNGNPFIEQSGTVTFNGNGAQTITTVFGGGETFYNLTTAGSGTTTLGSVVTVTNNFTISSTSQIDVSATPYNFTIGKNWNVTSTNGNPFVERTGTVTFNGSSAHSITTVLAGGETFNNLTIDGSGTATLGSAITVAADLTIASTAQLDVSGSNYFITIGDDWSVTSLHSNPFVENAGTVTFNGSGIQTQSTGLGTGETFYNLIIANTAGEVQLTSATAPTNVSNQLTINASPATLNANGKNMNISGNWTNSGGTFTPGAGTVTFNGTGTQTITLAGGSTNSFSNLSTNKTTGVLTLSATTDVTVTGTLTMTSGLYDLNGRTLTLGTAGGASTLTRTGSTTTNWVYGGKFKRFWPDNGTITTADYGLFPMGSSSSSSYRPFEISSSGAPITSANAYFQLDHVDVSTITDITPAGSEGINRITDAQFLTTVSGVTAGTFTLDVTMTGLGTAGDINDIRLAKFVAGPTAGVVGTHATATGPLANPTAKRTAVDIGDLDDNLDYRISTDDRSTTPLRQIYYSRQTGNWSDDVAPSTWSLDDGATDCSCKPPSTGYVIIKAGHNVAIDVPGTTAEFVDIKNNGIMSGTASFSITKDLTTLGDGQFNTASGTWSVTRDVSLNGTSNCTSGGALSVGGKLKISSGATLNMSAALTVSGNVQVDGTLAMGGNNLTANGTGITISGSGGAKTISGTGTITLTNNKSIDATTDLTINPAIAISAATTVTNNGTVTTTNNINGVNLTTSIWTNTDNSVLNISGTLLTTGVLNASANGNTVKYDKAGDQTVKIPASSYFNLKLSTSGIKTFTSAGTITVDNLLTIEGSSIFNTQTNTLNGAGGLTMTGTSELKLGKNGVTLPELTAGAQPYTLTAGKITFTGNGAQTMRDATSAVYYNVEIINTAAAGTGVSLANATTIANVLTLNDGELILNSKTLTISNNTPGAITGGSAISYIKSEGENSILKWNIENTVGDFDFPFGKDGVYIPFKLKNKTAGTGAGSYSVSNWYTAGNAVWPTATGATGVCGETATENDVTDRFWVITLAGYTANPASDVYFYFNPAELDGVAEADLQVQRWDATMPDLPCKWVTPPVGTVDETNNYVAVTGISQFSPWGMIKKSKPLPIELLSFQAEIIGNYVALNWITASEINNDFFTVEKTTNAKDFEKVAVVKGAGNSNEMKKYQTTDENPYKGISYYRLKQTDNDGRSSFSELVAINYSDNNGVEFFVFPNPSNGKVINVSFKGNGEKEEILVVLQDIYGKDFFSKILLTDDNGSFILAFNPEKILPAGIYIVVGSSRNDIYSRKLIIK